MPKTNLADILKNGENFKLKKPSLKRIEQIFLRSKNYEKRCIENKRLDYQKLNHFVLKYSSPYFSPQSNYLPINN